MVRLRRLAALTFIVVSVAVVWHFARQKSISTKLEEIDTLLTELHDLDKFNGTVLVAVNGEPVYEKGFGFRDAASETRHNTDSIFRIYSITKSFTSTMVFKLIEDGKLSLDDPIEKFFPELPHANEITVEHLLTHTSGLYDFAQETDFDNTEDSLLKLLRSKELEFPVGQGWQYCNSGYCLLGHIIARLTGMSYEEAVTTHILKPAGMNNSGFGFAELTHANKSVGYLPYTGKRWNTAGDVTPKPFAAGALYSTIGDLLLFHKAMLGNEIISEASRNKAWSGSQQQRGYGRGWEIDHRWIRRKVVSHSGGAAGFRSNFSQIPSEGWCVIALSNRESDSPGFVTSRIYDILDNRGTALPKEVNVDPARLAGYGGFYQTEGKRPMSVRMCMVGSRLAAEPAGQPMNTLIALGEGKFTHPEANATLEFRRGGDDQVNGVVLRQGFRSMTARRIQETWGVLGNATSAGWDGPDIALARVPDQPGKWSLPNLELTDGELLFRVNNDWDFNYGDSGDGVLDRNGPNIVVQAGVYDVLLDTSASPTLSYELRAVR